MLTSWPRPDVVEAAVAGCHSPAVRREFIQTLRLTKSSARSLRALVGVGPPSHCRSLHDPLLPLLENARLSVLGQPPAGPDAEPAERRRVRAAAGRR